MPEEVPRKTEESKSTISRREFLKDAGLIVGGATVGSMALINACGATATVTAPGGTTTKTVTSTAPGQGGATVTTTVTQPGGTGVVTVTGPTITQVVEKAATTKVKLTVNKKAYEVETKSSWTLQSLLREKLGIMSPKDMCLGYGACGSCSVIVGGRPVLSCMILACECGGAVIETAEGIVDAKHPLADAYVLNHCMQCGYCTPGFLVTAKALLDHNPKPTEADIREILAGSICRCGTYPAHIKAILQAAGG